MRDKYNLNTLPASLAALDECEYGEWELKSTWTLRTFFISEIY